MADEVELAENRTFPAPPPFYKSFTKENLDALKRLRQATSDDGAFAKDSRTASTALQSLQVPDELRHLIPPALPGELDKYRVFADVQDITDERPTLASAEIPQLFPSPSLTPSSSQTDTEWTVDRVYYLKKLVRSIMLNFLELMGTLSTDSSQWQDKFETLRVLFYNAQSLVNEYRGHQARETLILMMEKQLREKTNEVADIGRLQARIGEILNGLEAGAPTMSAKNNGVLNGHAAAVDEAVGHRKKEQKAMWEALDVEVGI